MEPKLKKLLAFALTLVLVVTTLPERGAWSQVPQGQIPSSATLGDNSAFSHIGQGAPLTTEEINSLVSPIALYPDALVAQILGAATFPDQIAVANYWLGQNKNLTGTALMQAVIPISVERAGMPINTDFDFVLTHDTDVAVFHFDVFTDENLLRHPPRTPCATFPVR